MKKPEQFEIDAAPTITVGKHKLSVCEIVARQNRVLTPLILARIEVFIRAKMANDRGDAMGLVISEEDFDAFLRIIRIGVSRAHPDLTEEEMLEWPIKTLELIAAVMIIAKHAGLMPEETEIPLALTATQATPAAPTGTPLPSPSPSPGDGQSMTS